jgi:hypothetical protein
MRISAEDLAQIYGLITKLYSLPFSGPLILESARVVCRIVDAQYITLFLFTSDGKSSPFAVSTNPSDYIPVYFSVAKEDFLLGACRTSPWGLPEIFVAW